MVAAEIPVDEPARLRVLAALEVLDTSSDETLDALVRTAAAVIGCPVSVVSLVDESRQWFKARFGFDFSQTSRDVALCSHAILQDDVFEINDCREDHRFADNPLVKTDPSVRFYAGVPIAVDGQKIGTFCVMDHVPRALDASQRAILRDLSRAAQNWFESRHDRQSLAHSGMLGRELFENLADGVMSIDPAGQIRDANAQALAMFGYDRRELIGQPLVALLATYRMPGLATDPLLPTIQRPSHVRECAMLRKNGALFRAELHVSFMSDRGFLAVVHDASDRQVLQRLLQQHPDTIEQSFSGTMICDLEGTFVYANKAALEMTGFSRPELIGSDYRILESPNAPSETYEAIRTTLRAGGHWSGMLQGRKKDGTEYAHLAAITPIASENGDVTHILIVTEDITERRRLSMELKKHRASLEELAQRTKELALAKRAAEAASRAKSDFLASMSHEIRTPMNGVLGIVEVLRASPLDRYQLELTDTIRDSGLALLAIIDEVLDFSKIEAGHLDIRSEAVDLLVLAEGVCDALLPVATSRGVSLDVFVSPALPTRIVSDELRLRQLLNNLLGNAIKFSSGRAEPGRVWLRIEPGEAGTFRIVVRDNGIGMARKVQKNIFEPFIQAEGTTTRRFGGTGLGLTICRKLVTSFGGTISVKSAPEKGAVFTLTLPMKPVDEAGAEATSQSLEGLHCHVFLRDSTRARDWTEYLVATGATVRAWRRCPSLQMMAALHEDSRHVLLVDVDDPTSSTLRDNAAAAGIAMIEVRTGTHCGGQPIRHGAVALESGAVRRATLVDSVALVAGRRRANVAFENPQGFRIPQKPDRAEAAAHGRLILVAEDNDLNRKVIEQQLTLLGLSADVAVNGVEALERWRSGNYGLLLTDLHMPYMDGYTLTSQIRREEASRAASTGALAARLPIVALTANALRGESDRCLAVGMDAYLTKPLQLEPLAKTLARWLPQTGGGDTSDPVTPEDREADADVESLPVYDNAMLPRLLGDDRQVLAEVRHEFVRSAKAATDALRVAVANGECATVESLAHRQKSSARAIGGIAFGEWCARLERASATSPTPDLAALLVEYESALASLLTAMGCDEATAAVAPKHPPVAAIVVVDDEPLQLDLIRRQLRCQDAPVSGYESAATALASMENCDTSAMLLLVDLNMPDMDGVELMRQLAERRYAGALALISGADTRVLETASKLASAYKLNVLSYLHKPVMRDALHDVLERWRTFIPGRSRPEGKAYTASDIREGLDRDQFFLQYQPKVSLTDGSLVGVEALVRWLHPADGVVYPDRFIDVAENHGLIDELTYVIVEKAASQARSWRDGGLGLRVAVNISMRNLARLDFPGRVFEIIERHGMRPDDLMLEVTESTLMADARAPLSTLTRLRMREVGLSIDDFGTGHSSLAQLRDIPFDELKIDRGFVHGVATHPTQQAIFLASLNMAHQLNMKVVAEGVEDSVDWHFVRDAGCDVAQGYFIARPLDAAAVIEWKALWADRYAEHGNVRH